MNAERNFWAWVSMPPPVEPDPHITILTVVLSAYDADSGV